MYTYLFLVRLRNKYSVNHARILFWNRPVLNNEGNVSCSRSTDYESDELPFAPHRHFSLFLNDCMLSDMFKTKNDFLI